MSPDTTAIVVSHNHAAYIEQCIESLTAQTTPPDQIVFVDDGSSDDSFAIGSRLVRERFANHVFIHHPSAVGLCRSLNEALASSTGTFIGMVAADDFWKPRKTATQLAVFGRSSPETVVVYGDAEIVDADGAPTGQSFLERFVPQGRPPDESVFDHLLLEGNFIPGMATLIRRARLVEVGGWDESLFYEDWDMWLRLSRRWAFVSHSDVVASYRVLSTSMSNSGTDQMWLSKLVIATKWAGVRGRADLRMLRATLRVTVARTVRADFRYLAQWMRLTVATVVRRIPVTRARRAMP